MNIETTLAEMLDSYNWREVFGYAGDPESRETGGDPEPIPGESCSTVGFGRSDVAEILGSVEGENDGESWVAVGRLRDGRHFAVRGGCDYTGWD